jgi:soluble lytic murein transglycosylase-like protein
MPVQVRYGLHFLPLFLPLLLASGQETVHLKNGFSLVAESHTQTAGRMVLRTGTGTLEIPVEDVASIDTSVVAASKTAPAMRPQDVLDAAAGDQRIPPELVRSVAKAESDFRGDAVSAKGALGLMQLMPSTARELGVDPARADQNAEGGAKYLRELLIRYHGDSALALAAYNAGPGAVDRFGGVPPYIETRRYVLKVLREYERQHKLEQIPKVNKPSATN